MSYLSLTDADREAMLAAIGVDTVDDLFRDIPAGVRFGRDLDLEPPLTEAELQRHLEELAARNVDTTRELSFLGAGVYDHYVPAVADAVLLVKAGAATWIVIVAFVASASESIVHVTVPVPPTAGVLQPQPAAAVRETNVVLAGSASDTATVVASAAVRLVTPIV